jgi:hypothetical protein
LGGEHEVDAVFLGDGGGFIFFGPGVDVALDGEVVVGEEVDAEAVLALWKSDRIQGVWGVRLASSVSR